MGNFVAFKPEEGKESIKEFDGQIIAIDYSEEPFGMAGAEGIAKRGKVLCIKIQTDSYEKPQYEWYPPSMIKQTKWLTFIEALAACGALAQTTSAGVTDDERVQSFAHSLLGMKFHWEERELTSLVKDKGGAAKKFNVTVPTTFMGKLAIQVPVEVKQATIEQDLR